MLLKWVGELGGWQSISITNIPIILYILSDPNIRRFTICGPHGFAVDKMLPASTFAAMCFTYSWVFFRVFMGFFTVFRGHIRAFYRIFDFPLWFTNWQEPFPPFFHWNNSPLFMAFSSNVSPVNSRVRHYIAGTHAWLAWTLRRLGGGGGGMHGGRPLPGR